jgi:hypothetical protein
MRIGEGNLFEKCGMAFYSSFPFILVLIKLAPGQDYEFFIRVALALVLVLFLQIDETSEHVLMNI